MSSFDVVAQVCQFTLRLGGANSRVVIEGSLERRAPAEARLGSVRIRTGYLAAVAVPIESALNC